MNAWPPRWLIDECPAAGIQAARSRMAAPGVRANILKRRYRGRPLFEWRFLHYGFETYEDEGEA